MERPFEALKHAFAVDPEPAASGELPASLERLAGAVVARRMEVPAITLLESVAPLGFLGSQIVHALRPLVRLAGLPADEWREVAEQLEDRRTLRRLADRIEELAESAGSGK
ncbi:MAG: hypothetical protein R6V85_19080 [Polyangia bacterium]